MVVTNKRTEQKKEKRRMIMDDKSKYKEALERARQVMEGKTGFIRKEVEEVFPELKESEDERIRRELIAFLKENLETGRADETWSLSGLKKWISWLEKQGEQLPVGFYYVNSEGKKFYSDAFKYGDVILHVEKQGEQKPAWSEEDEERITNTLSVLSVQVCWDGATGEKKNPYQKEIDWLKSLQQRIGG
jgi:hypothetical protein